MENVSEDYRKYRWFFTSSGKLVVGGRSAMQNDELLRRARSMNKEHVVMHTSEPGSPFSVILVDKDKVSERDKEECAVFTGCFSRAWREGRKRVSIDIFNLSQLRKTSSMKIGSWGVKGEIERRIVGLELVITKQKGVLRAVPEKSVKKKEVLLRIQPGKIDKQGILPKIQVEIEEDLKQEEVLSALPSGGISILRR